MSAGIRDQAREANRLKDQVLSQSERSLSAAGKLLRGAVRGQRSVYFVGQGSLDWIGRYLAELFISADAGAYAIASRALTDRPGMADGAPRAVEAFVCRGEVLVVLAAISTPRLERAIALAHEQGAHVIGLLGLEAEGLARRCSASVLIPTAQNAVVVELILTTGHSLLDQLLIDLERLSEEGALLPSGSGATPPPPPPPPRPVASPPAPPARPLPEPRGPTPSSLGVIDRDPRNNDSSGNFPSAEAALLQSAVEDYAPPTNPRGVKRGAPPIPAAPLPGTVRFRCAACNEVMNVDARYAGRQGNCPHCSADLVIPKHDPGATGTQRTTLHEIEARRKKKRRGSGRNRGGAGANERRRSPRFQVKDAVVRLSVDGFPDGRTYIEPHVLDDLSLTGLRFIGRSKDHEIGTQYYVTIDCPAFAAPLRARGEVRRVIKLKREAGFATGVRFLEYVGDAEAKIRRLLENDNLRGVRRR